MRTLGIDPGSLDGGAAVLTPDGRMIDWLAWWTLRRKSGPVMMVAGFCCLQRPWRFERALASLAQQHGPMHVVCEDLMRISGRKMNPSTVITLAEAAGAAIGAVSQQTTTLRRVLATDWRPIVLSLPKRYDAKRAEEMAIDQAPRIIESAHWDDIAGLPKRARGAVAEAACIARWGHVTRQREAG